MPDLQVTVRNAQFQHWQTLLTNRQKRHRAGEFVVQGVRPVTLALNASWPLSQVLYDRQRPLSTWARQTLDRTSAPRVGVTSDLMAELGEQDSAPEVLLVGRIPAPTLPQLTKDFLGVVFDRPTTPGNLGTLIRSADALGAHAVVTTGHAADLYDPRTLRATTGSFFALPTAAAETAAEVIAWAAGLQVVGLDETAEAPLTQVDLTRPSLLVVGSEKTGLSQAWRGACEVLTSIPMSGAASSLNVASAATVVLYEAARQRA